MKQFIRNILRLLAKVAAPIIILVILLLFWCQSAERHAYTPPSATRQDITAYQQVTSPPLTSSAYQLLLQQTGLYPQAITALYEQDLASWLSVYQDAYYRQPHYTCASNTIVSREERLEEPGGLICLPALEDGDILITFNCHVFGWRNGHAAIVVDAAKGLTLEARVLGTDSAIRSVAHWENYPSFSILRLKDADASQRAAIAAYARESLVDLPYQLTAGIKDAWFSALPGYIPTPSGTQCAHLVWYAYQTFDYDLDSDGGCIVTPRDIYDSPLLEPIQIYGLPYPHM